MNVHANQVARSVVKARGCGSTANALSRAALVIGTPLRPVQVISAKPAAARPELRHRLLSETLLLRRARRCLQSTGRRKPSRTQRFPLARCRDALRNAPPPAPHATRGTRARALAGADCTSPSASPKRPRRPLPHDVARGSRRHSCKGSWPEALLPLNRRRIESAQHNQTTRGVGSGRS